MEKQEYYEIDRAELDGEADDFMPVVAPEVWTIKRMIDIKHRTAGRFNYQFVPHSEGKLATVRYVNYDLTVDGKLQLCLVQDPANDKFLGAFKLEKRVELEVEVERE